MIVPLATGLLIVILALLWFFKWRKPKDGSGSVSRRAD